MFATDTDDNNDDNNDLFTEQASCGTSPIDSGNDTNDADDNVVYEVTDDDDVIIEKPAESAQAELSVHFPLKHCLELTF